MFTSSSVRRGITRIAASTALAVVGLGAGTAAVLAYPTPPASGTLAAGCSTVASGGSCSFTFKFVDANGQPVTGAPVTFTVSGVLGASVTPAGVTDASGVAGTTLTTGSGCGTATITAASGSATAQTTVNITCATTAGLPLPPTSTGIPTPSPWAYPAIALSVLVLVGGALTLRQTRRTP